MKTKNFWIVRNIRSTKSKKPNTKRAEAERGTRINVGPTSGPDSTGYLMSKFRILATLALSALAYGVSEVGFWYSLVNTFTGDDSLAARLLYPPLFAYLAIHFVGHLKGSIAVYRSFNTEVASEVHDE